MIKTSNPFRHIKLTVRRSSRPIKIVTLVAVALSILALVTLHIAIANEKAETERLRQEAAGLEHEKSRLELYIEQLGTIEGIIRIAQEELGLIEPGSVIIQPE